MPSLKVGMRYKIGGNVRVQVEGGGWRGAWKGDEGEPEPRRGGPASAPSLA